MVGIPFPVKPPILNVFDEDIRPMLERAADEAGIPLELALACAIAESGLNPRAERLGVYPDISFGYAQISIAYHWAGDGTGSQENVAMVRDAVFSDPQRDLIEMALRLKSCLERATTGNLTPVDGDVFLGALVIYNAGHLPAPDSSWWVRWAGNVANYRNALERARRILNG